MRKIKKSLSLTLVFALLFSMMIVPAGAAEGNVITGSCGDSLTYTLTEKADGNYDMVISGEGAMTDFGLRSNRAPWYSECAKIVSVSLPDNITYIGNYAFNGCEFTEITIPVAVTGVGRSAFQSCRLLTEIKYGGTTEQWLSFKISTSANVTCSDTDKVSIISFVTVPSTAVVALSDKEGNAVTGTANKYAVIKGETYNYTVSADTYITKTGTVNSEENQEISVTLEDDPSPIAVMSGSYGESLEYKLIRTINDGVTTCTLEFTGSGAMEDARTYSNVPWYKNYADKITSVVMSEGLTHIGKYAFYGCKNLTSINIPGSVASIGYSAFGYCTNLKTLTLPEGLEIIDGYVFQYCEGFHSIIIPSSVISIGNNAFQYCKSITNITIPDKVTALPMCAFWECSSLESITLPAGIKSIGMMNCFKCSSLKNITFKGTAEQWISIDINSNNTELNSASVVCSDSDTVALFKFTADPSDANILVKDAEGNEITAAKANTYILDKSKSYNYTVSSDGYVSESGFLDLNVNNKKVSLKKVPAPIITAQPVSARYNTGDTNVAALSVEVEIPAEGTLSYQWYTNGVAIDDATKSSYIPSIAKQGMDSYYCVVTNTLEGAAVSTTSDTVNVIVEPADAVASGTVDTGLFWILTHHDGSAEENPEYILTFSGSGQLTVSNDGEWSVYKDNITSIVMEEGVTGVSTASSVFQEYPALTTVKFPSTFSILGSKAFINTNTITDVYYNGTTKSWLGLAASNNSALKYADIHASDSDYMAVLTFVTTPSSGVSIKVEQNGYEITAAKDKVYIVETGKECTWSVSADEPYIAKTVTNTYNSSESVNVELELDKTPKVMDSGVCGSGLTYQYVRVGLEYQLNIKYDGVGTGVMTDYSSEKDTPWYKGGYYSNVTSVSLPEGLIHVGDYSLSCLSKVKSIVFPEGVISIGGNVCLLCNKLAEITLPSTLTSLENAAFYLSNSSERGRNVNVYYDGSAVDFEKVEQGNNALPCSYGTKNYTMIYNVWELTFSIAPEDPLAETLITVKNDSKNRVLTPVNGIYYIIKGDTCTYTVNRSGYAPVTAALTPAEDTDIELELNKNAAGKYSISVNSDGYGTVAAFPTASYVGTADAGEKVNLVITTEEGCKLADVNYTVNGSTPVSIAADEQGAYSFIMPAGDVTVNAVFEAGWYGIGNHSEDGVYTVKTENELREFAAVVNGTHKSISQYSFEGKTVKLGADITLNDNWTPVGSKKYPFSGTFDGCGHAIGEMKLNHLITGLENQMSSEVYLGLFGYVSGGTLRNITVSGSVSINSDENINYSNQNVINNAVYPTSYAGGVAAYIENTSVSGCSSLVNMEATVVGYTGGIAGYAKKSNFTDCVNYGNITTTRRLGTSAGGITGYLYLCTDGSAPEIYQCVNYGNIDIQYYAVYNSGEYEGSSYNELRTCAFGSVGGLVGITYDSNTGITLSSSTNKGNLTGQGRYMGGIVGSNANLWSSYISLKLENCYNTGSITNTNGYMVGNSSEYAVLGGLVGLTDDGYNTASVVNCYNKGIVNAAAGGYVYTAELCGYEKRDKSYASVSNSYTGTELDALTDAAGALGNAYKAGEESPLLSWESEGSTDKEYTVTFKVSGTENYKITIQKGNALYLPESDGTYKLTGGTYSYKVTADGCVTEIGTFRVTVAPVTVKVEMKAAAKVIFNIDPAYAVLKLSDASGSEVTADSAEGGVYTFNLYSGSVYLYSASAEGYNSTGGSFTAGTETGNINIVLTKSAAVNADGTIYGDGNKGQINTITAKGIYKIGDGAVGTITVNTTEEVTLVGSGIGKDSIYSELSINCVQPGTHLTIQDVYIYNEETQDRSMIDFNGSGNCLNFAGTSVLEKNTDMSGYSMIHVNEDTELTITGGTAYLYKRDQGAGIGGNGSGNGAECPEYNGRININNARLFIKNSKQGAMIGSGAKASSLDTAPGSISIKNSELNLVAISRGAGIGGSAGSSGGAVGTDVYVENSNININVDWSGAAIGGGGFDANNTDSFVGGIANDADGGILHYTSGTIRTYIDNNAKGAWNVESAGVNGNKAITAKIQNSNGEQLYLLEFDTGKSKADTFVVKENDKTIYSGGLHKYSYVNEDFQKEDQSSIDFAPSNWGVLDDSNLYLYLTGEDHVLNVNGNIYNVAWSSETEKFTVSMNEGGNEPEPGDNIDISIGNGSAEGTTVNGVTTFAAGTTDGAPLVTVTAPENGWKAGVNTFTVGADKACIVIVQNADGTYTKLEAAEMEGLEDVYSFTTDESFNAGCKIIVSMTGDVDGNGQINQTDYLYVLAAIRGGNLDRLAELRADVNSDGAISQTDYLYTLSAVRGASLSW